MASLFRARFDVSHINDISPGVWELGGKIVDLTGSFSAQDVSTGDKIIMRGIALGGYTVFDRLKVVTIVSRNAVDLVIRVENDIEGTLQTAAGRPAGGSFPIGCHLWHEKLTNKASFYQSQFDPDYDAAIDNLNLQELQFQLRTLSCNEIIGGHHCYATIEERDNLSVDLRMWGMVVSVFNDPNNAFLNGNYELIYNKSSNYLGDNANWRRISKEIIEITNQSSGLILASAHQLSIPIPQFYILNGGTYKSAIVSYSIDTQGNITWNSINPITGYLVLI